MTNLDLTKLPNKAPEYDLQQLLEAGCHFGHQKRKWHPKMAPYIYMEKDGVHIFDLAKTAQQLQLAYNYAYQLGKEGKLLIFVGTKRQAREVITEAALDAGAMYINSRWLGGFLTNWKQIYKSIKHMLELEKGLESDKFENYTKYEQVQLKKELIRLERFFQGVKQLKRRPDALFVVDPVREQIAVQEAQTMDIPVIAITDSNADPNLVDLPIPANDDAFGSIKLITQQVAQAYKAGKSS
ncbi:MAG: 30S ribosomal protein S2 [Candidatus Pacebacteria bacterium]|nr:30S ribosomal protein S2 [Candidatus Paceibacterota bacterium]